MGPVSTAPPGSIAKTPLVTLANLKHYNALQFFGAASQTWAIIAWRSEDEDVAARRYVAKVSASAAVFCWPRKSTFERRWHRQRDLGLQSLRRNPDLAPSEYADLRRPDLV